MALRVDPDQPSSPSRQIVEAVLDRIAEVDGNVLRAVTAMVA